MAPNLFLPPKSNSFSSLLANCFTQIVTKINCSRYHIYVVDIGIRWSNIGITITEIDHGKSIGLTTDITSIVLRGQLLDTYCGLQTNGSETSSVNTLRPRQNGRHFAAAVSNAFLMKMFEFRLQFYRSLFLKTWLTISVQITAKRRPGQATSHNLNQWWLVYRRIYAPLGPSDLIV